ncbi:DUF2934 domain-containing protein [Xanthomonas campestris]|uniref:DUF2934 domain-containing protein n=1 Tax=Xanthomonas campestris TaxID=339 RepID=UPI0005AEFFD6|nr:DUF2934 domain-containing protein [Xanthomonas campestris]KIQ26578.1 hypothetical protein RT95_12415 [Xanthomonas campestris]MEB2232849.1 DUF2934 domain-containing protein [Xanthomonas campestris pv. campestris]WDI93330.1 DUF2934 domain-containing protein [Xanthomonas campestris]
MNDTQRQARLRQLAQEIWEAEGRPDGHADRHWAMAERLVEAEIRAAEQGAAAPAGPRVVASS